MAISIERIHPGFGARITGVSLARGVDDATFKEIFDAFNDYSVLVFPEQPMTDDQQIAFSRRFGELEETINSIANNPKVARQIAFLANIDPDGNLIDPNDKRMIYHSANQLWHTDSIFKDPPAVASVLTARVIPPSGGETEFASQRLAWERLPDSLRARLANATAWHDYAHSRGKIAPHLASERERAALPPVRWPIRWRNPANGRDSLYIASHTCAIDGMPKEEALALIDELAAHVTAPGHTYLHRWQAGDVIMWDNRCVLHRGRPWPNDKPRYVARTTITATDADGLADMRALLPAA